MPAEYTLSNGEVVLLRDKNTSKKYATGPKHPTNNWGDVEIVGMKHFDPHETNPRRKQMKPLAPQELTVFNYLKNNPRRIRAMTIALNLKSSQINMAIDRIKRKGYDIPEPLPTLYTQVFTALPYDIIAHVKVQFCVSGNHKVTVIQYHIIREYAERIVVGVDGDTRGTSMYKRTLDVLHHNPRTHTFSCKTDWKKVDEVMVNIHKKYKVHMQKMLLGLKRKM